MPEVIDAGEDADGRETGGDDGSVSADTTGERADDAWEGGVSARSPWGIPVRGLTSAFSVGATSTTAGLLRSIDEAR
jgi:hypothetical protein